MFTGALIAESLEPGTELDVQLTVTHIERLLVTDHTDDQPPVWTVLHFTVEDSEAGPLAEKLSGHLARPGWYADLRSPDEVFVVFRDRIFRYPRGDARARSDAEAHGRSLGVPDTQLDWPG